MEEELAVDSTELSEEVVVGDEKEEGEVAETEDTNIEDKLYAKEASLLSDALPNSTPVHALPMRNYLEETVVPLLISGLSSLTKERPSDPVDYLAAYLLKHNPKRRQEPTASS